MAVQVNNNVAGPALDLSNSGKDIFNALNLLGLDPIDPRQYSVFTSSNIVKVDPTRANDADYAVYLNALITAQSAGTVILIPPGSYSIQTTIVPKAGVSLCAPQSGAIFTWTSGSNNNMFASGSAVNSYGIYGITWDSNLVSSGPVLWGQDIVFIGNIVKNNGTLAVGNVNFRYGVRLIGTGTGRIICSGNKFSTNVETAIMAYSLGGRSFITYNKFDNCTEPIHTIGCSYTDISYNEMYNLTRMGIEIQNSGGITPEIRVTNNIIKDWLNDVTQTNSYGISSASDYTGTGAIIVENNSIDAGTVATQAVTGMEVSGFGSVYKNNSIYNCTTGMAVSAARDVLITENVFYGNTTDILSTNLSGTFGSITISNNVSLNCKTVFGNLSSSSQGNASKYTSIKFSGNIITREIGAFGNEDSATWYAFSQHGLYSGNNNVEYSDNEVSLLGVTSSTSLSWAQTASNATSSGGTLTNLANGQVYSISSITRTSNVVTVTLATAAHLVLKKNVTIAGVSDSSFNGTFMITTVNSPNATMAGNFSLFRNFSFNSGSLPSTSNCLGVKCLRNKMTGVDAQVGSWCTYNSVFSASYGIYYIDNVANNIKTVSEITLEAYPFYNSGNITINVTSVALSSAPSGGQRRWAYKRVTGQQVITGNGATTSFSIPHGLGYLPLRWAISSGMNTSTGAVLNATSLVPAGIADTTNLTLAFSSAPAAGNYAFSWEAEG